MKVLLMRNVKNGFQLLIVMFNCCIVYVYEVGIGVLKLILVDVDLQLYVLGCSLSIKQISLFSLVYIMNIIMVFLNEQFCLRLIDCSYVLVICYGCGEIKFLLLVIKVIIWVYIIIREVEGREYIFMFIDFLNLF